MREISDSLKEKMATNAQAAKEREDARQAKAQEVAQRVEERKIVRNAIAAGENPDEVLAVHRALRDGPIQPNQPAATAGSLLAPDELNRAPKIENPERRPECSVRFM